MKLSRVFTTLILIVSLFSGCKRDKKDYYHLPAMVGNQINAVIEIPAGTNHKIEYDKVANDFGNKEERVIDFLPYPGNYGFVPSTEMSKAKGGDGDALDILVIAESLSTGSVLLVKPLATLLLHDNDEIDTKIIAIPIDSKKRVIHAQNFMSFMIEYDAARRIIENWFLSYKGLGKTKLIGWKDADYALREVKKWEVTPDTN